MLALVGQEINFCLEICTHRSTANYCNKLKSFFSYHQHHHGELTARIILSLSRHPSRSTIAIVKSSIWHPVSAQIWWTYIFAGRPTLVCPWVVVHWKNVAYKFVLTSPAGSFSSFFFFFWWLVKWEVNSCTTVGGLLPGFVQNSIIV